MSNLTRLGYILAWLAGVVVLVLVIRHFMQGTDTANATNEPPPPPPDLVQKPGPRDIAPDSTRYPGVNDAAAIINVRRPGHQYATMTIGQVSGEGYKKDWGLKGSAKFRLTWTLESTGDVISNDGQTIVEERSFSFDELLIFDAVSAGLELSSEQMGTIAVLVGGIVDLFGGSGAAIPATAAVLETVNGKQVSLSGEQLKRLVQAGKLLGLSDSLDIERGIRLLLPRPDFGMLDGKKVRLTFRNGEGIVNVEPLGCTLSDHETTVITRTNALSDHYIFPERARDVGETWRVPADNLGSMIDPRLRGVIINSDVRLKRSNDSPDSSGGTVRNVVIDGPQRITIGSTAEGKATTGELQLDEARFELPDKDGVVTRLEGSGSADYRERSVDHLLFDMDMRIRPSFTVIGQTTVSKVR